MQCNAYKSETFAVFLVGYASNQFVFSFLEHGSQSASRYGVDRVTWWKGGFIGRIVQCIQGDILERGGRVRLDGCKKSAGALRLELV